MSNLYIPAQNIRPFSILFTTTVSALAAKGTAFGPLTNQVPTDRDFVLCRLACGMRDDTTGVVYQSGSINTNSTGIDSDPDAPFTLQVRDSGSQGVGLFDQATDARLIANNIKGNGDRLIRPWLFKAGNTITVEGSTLKAAAAINLQRISILLIGWADYSIPSRR